jgi:hypothetical protein
MTKTSNTDVLVSVLEVFREDGLLIALKTLKFQISNVALVTTLGLRYLRGVCSVVALITHQYRPHLLG